MKKKAEEISALPFQESHPREKARRVASYNPQNDWLQIAEIERSLGELTGTRAGLGFGFGMPTLPEMRVAMENKPQLRPEILRLLKRWFTLKEKVDSWVRLKAKQETLSTIRKEIAPLSSAEKKARSVGVRRRLEKAKQYQKDYNLTPQKAFYRAVLDEISAFAGRAKNPHVLDRNRSMEILLETRP